MLMSFSYSAAASRDRHRCILFHSCEVNNFCYSWFRCHAYGNPYPWNINIYAACKESNSDLGQGEKV